MCPLFLENSPEFLRFLQGGIVRRHEDVVFFVGHFLCLAVLLLVECNFLPLNAILIQNANFLKI